MVDVDTEIHNKTVLRWHDSLEELWQEIWTYADAHQEFRGEFAHPLELIGHAQRCLTRILKT